MWRDCRESRGRRGIHEECTAVVVPMSFALEEGSFLYSVSAGCESMCLSVWRAFLAGVRDAELREASPRRTVRIACVGGIWTAAARDDVTSAWRQVRRPRAQRGERCLRMRREA